MLIWWNKYKYNAGVFESACWHVSATPHKNSHCYWDVWFLKKWMNLKWVNWIHAIIIMKQTFCNGRTYGLLLFIWIHLILQSKHFLMVVSFWQGLGTKVQRIMVEHKSELLTIVVSDQSIWSLPHTEVCSPAHSRHMKKQRST